MGIFHRNTKTDRELHLRRFDPSRDTLPSFEAQKAGIPSCPNPRGSKSAPNYKVVPHDGTTTMPKAPWGMLYNFERVPLNHRNCPPTIRHMIRSQRPHCATPPPI